MNIVETLSLHTGTMLAALAVEIMAFPASAAAQEPSAQAPSAGAADSPAQAAQGVPYAPPAMYPSPPPAAVSTEVIVTLRDGALYRGTPIERIPGDHLTIRLSTGEARRLAWVDIVSESMAPAIPAARLPLPMTTLVRTPPKRWSPRLRFEVGLEGGFTVAYHSDYSPEAPAQDTLWAVGSHIRLGVQFNDWIDAQIETSGGYVHVSYYVRGALTVGYTPFSWFTVHLGPMIGNGASTGTVNDGWAGATFRTDFHIFQHRAESGRRHSFTLGIGGDLGGFIDQPFSFRGRRGPIVGGMFDIGYSAH